MAHITLTLTLDASKADKFGMPVVKMEVPQGFAIVGKLGWMLQERGHFPLKKLATAEKPAAKEAAVPAMDPAMLAAFQAFMAAQGAPAAKPVVKKATSKKVA